nr:zinc ribbon domain-containing protein [Candidatus Sigynarchaeota archaeon]
MMFSTSVAMQYMLSQNVAQDEIEAMQTHAQAMNNPPSQVSVDDQTVSEYIQLIQDPKTPDSIIEQFFQRKGLTDDQIILMQQKAVKRMEPITKDGGTTDIYAGKNLGSIIYCPDCGKGYQRGAVNFCTNCGKDLRT